MDQPNRDSTQLTGCFVRLCWMAVGNLILVMAAITIVQERGGFALTFRDAVFGATALCLPALRYVDIRFLHGKTGDGQPATMADWGRYTATILGASAALWLLAHAIS